MCVVFPPSQLGTVDWCSKFRTYSCFSSQWFDSTFVADNAAFDLLIRSSSLAHCMQKISCVIDQKRSHNQQKSHNKMKLLFLWRRTLNRRPFWQPTYVAFVELAYILWWLRHSFNITTLLSLWLQTQSTYRSKWSLPAVSW